MVYNFLHSLFTVSSPLHYYYDIPILILTSSWHFIGPRNNLRYIPELLKDARTPLQELPQLRRAQQIVTQRRIIEGGIAISSLRSAQIASFAPHAAQHRYIIQGVGVEAHRATALAVGHLLLALTHQIEECNKKDEGYNANHANSDGNYDVNIRAGVTVRLLHIVIHIGGRL